MGGNFFHAYFSPERVDQLPAEEKAAYEELLRERELLMRCLYDDEMTGNFDVDEDEEDEDEDEDLCCDEALPDCNVCGEGEGEEGSSMNMAESGENQDGMMCSMNMAVEREKFYREMREDIRKSMTSDQLHNSGWPSFHGTAFSARIARCNHNCTPNMKFYFDQGTHKMRAKALRNISPGEEIFICYVEDSDPVQRRQKALKEYGFECRCPRCVRELQNNGGSAVSTGGVVGTQQKMTLGGA